MNAVIRQPIDHPSAWRPTDFPTKDVHSFDLTRTHIDAFDRAVAKLKTDGAADYAGIDRNGFDLSAIADDVQSWYRELSDGRGILNLRGFPVTERSVEDLSLMFYGLGTRWGEPVSQSVMGDRIGHIIEVKQLLHGERQRSYKRTHEMGLHSDFCDILGMLCIRSAMAGGASRYTSGATVHNEILATRPELLEHLYRGFYFWRLGEWPDEPVTPYRVPVFSSTQGKVSLHYFGDWNFIKPENTGVPITEEEREAISYFSEIAEREDIRYEFQIEPGECFLSNNLLHLHARSQIHNAPDPDQRRHMLRIWVDCPPSYREIVPEARVYGHGIGVPERPELVHEPGESCELREPASQSDLRDMFR